jgi:hypothetical protein
MAKQAKEIESVKSDFISILSGDHVEIKEGEKVLKIMAKELEYENKKYYGYNVIKKNGDKMQLKFTRVAKNIPVTEGTHYILVLESDVNVDTWSKIYPLMWCKNVIDLLHLDKLDKTELKKETLKEF